MDTQALGQILGEAKSARQRFSLTDQEHKTVIRNLHILAEAQYDPAIEFFLSCLDDLRWRWRYEGVSCLGFHYAFPPEGDITEKLRQMLLNDPEPIVRIAVASVLGKRSEWPDPALRTALRSDPDKIVRRAVFAALLTLAKVPLHLIQREEKRVEAGEMRPNWREVKRIIAEIEAAEKSSG